VVGEEKVRTCMIRRKCGKQKADWLEETTCDLGALNFNIAMQNVLTHPESESRKMAMPLTSPLNLFWEEEYLFE
jgi:hypothetical protein